MIAYLTSLDSAKELWRRKSAGGYSEVVFAEGRAITMELRDGDDYVIALDGDTGRERWAVRVGNTFKGHTGSSDGPIATPAIDSDLVFAAGPHGVVIALDAATGAERWRHDLIKEFGAAVPTYGYAGSPLVVNGRVLMATSGYAEVSRARVLTPEVTAVTGPSLAGNRMFLRNLGEMAAYRLANR